jgi:thymidylate synthase (FAD)
MPGSSKVKVIAVTKPVIDEIQTSDDVVAYTARVSNPTNQANSETAPRLLKYLKEHHHWSPFEMAHCVMEINTTRDIARQILRHRSFSFQEFSQRYQDVDSLSDLPYVKKEPRLQDSKNRQNSIVFNPEDNEELMDIYQAWNEQQVEVIKTAYKNYKQALQNGIAKEVARSLLPEGLTKSRLYMAGSLRSWIHYCELRMGVETQKEHREIATACWKELVKYFPSLLTE